MSRESGLPPWSGDVLLLLEDFKVEVGAVSDAGRLNGSTVRNALEIRTVLENALCGGDENTSESESEREEQLVDRLARFRAFMKHTVVNRRLVGEEQLGGADGPAGATAFPAVGISSPAPTAAVSSAAPPPPAAAEEKEEAEEEEEKEEQEEGHTTPAGYRTRAAPNWGISQEEDAEEEEEEEQEEGHTTTPAVYRTRAAHNREVEELRDNNNGGGVLAGLVKRNKKIRTVEI